MIGEVDDVTKPVRARVRMRAAVEIDDVAAIDYISSGGGGGCAVQASHCLCLCVGLPRQLDPRTELN